MIHIVTDSTADIPSQYVTELGITVVPCYIMFGEESYLDDVTLSREQFYARLAHTPRLPTTAAPGIGLFEEAYRKLAQPGDTLISIHVAEALSAMCNSSRVAARAMPDTPVVTYDSTSISMGLGSMVIAAARAARAGRSVAEIVAMLDDMKKRVHVYAMLDTLKYLRRSGRVRWAAAIIGEALNIKPILHVHQSIVESFDRVRSRALALTRMTQAVVQLGQLESLAVLHTAALAEAQALAKTVADLTPGQPIPVVEVTPTIGVHVGPNGLGFAAVVSQAAPGA